MSCTHCDLRIDWDTEEVSRTCKLSGLTVEMNCHCESFSEKSLDCSSALIDNNIEIKPSEYL